MNVVLLDTCFVFNSIQIIHSKATYLNNYLNCSICRSQKYLLLCLMAFMPMRVEPFEDLIVGSVLEPFRKDDDGGITIKVSGPHKTKATDGSAILSLVPELAALIQSFIRKMRAAKRFRGMDTRSFNNTRVFASVETGKKPSHLSSVIPTASQVLGRRLTATHFRKGAVNLSRQLGINAELFSKALMHSKETAFRHYLSAINPSMKGNSEHGACRIN